MNCTICRWEIGDNRKRYSLDRPLVYPLTLLKIEFELINQSRRLAMPGMVEILVPPGKIPDQTRQLLKAHLVKQMKGASHCKILQVTKLGHFDRYADYQRYLNNYLIQAKQREQQTKSQLDRIIFEHLSIEMRRAIVTGKPILLKRISSHSDREFLNLLKQAAKAQGLKWSRHIEEYVTEFCVWPEGQPQQAGSLFFRPV